MNKRERVLLEEVVMPAVTYAELQARFTFDPLVRDGTGGPSALTIRLQEALSALRSILKEDWKVASAAGRRGA